MKKILFCLCVMFMGILMANAEVVLDSSFEINLDETTRVQTYDKNAAKGDMDSYLYLYITH